MKRTTAVWVVAILVAFSARDGWAQTDTATGTASITIPTLISIAVADATVGFPAPDLSDYTTGYVDMNTTPSVITTRANIVHKVTIEADAATMTGPSAKPASDLQWGTGGFAGAFTGLSTTAADVVTALARGTHDPAATVWFRMLLDETNDEPGSYSLAFTYTALAN